MEFQFFVSLYSLYFTVNLVDGVASYGDKNQRQPSTLSTTWRSSWWPSQLLARLHVCWHRHGSDCSSCWSGDFARTLSPSKICREKFDWMFCRLRLAHNSTYTDLALVTFACWTLDAILVGLLVLVVIGVILWLCLHNTRENENKWNYWFWLCWHERFWKLSSCSCDCIELARWIDNEMEC